MHNNILLTFITSIFLLWLYFSQLLSKMQKQSVPGPAQQPKTARERAAAIKKAQEEALARLQLNTLYYSLYTIGSS